MCFHDTQSCINKLNEKRLFIKNTTANELIDDNEDDIASKSDNSSEYDQTSLLTASEGNEELDECINNSMDENNVPNSSGSFLLLEANSNINHDCDTNQN